MASATTSDSEDFESADEDIAEETTTQTINPRLSPSPTSASVDCDISEGVSVVSLKSNCQKELGKQNERHPGDAIKASIDDSGVPGQKIELESGGSGDLGLPSRPDLPTEDIKTTVTNTIPVTVDTDSKDDSANDEPPIERRRRQQKQREPKTSTGMAPKKLGTKITASAKTLPSTTQIEQAKTNVPENNDNQPSAELDPYAKFRGYSKPPMMQRCWETTPDGTPVLDNNESKMPSHPEIKSTSSESSDPVPDPYAKFRGYSEPPLREQCWEDGVDAEEDADDHAVSADVKIAPMFDKLAQATADKAAAGSSWGGWGNWGVTSLLSSATESVSTLTSHVTSVLESGLGAPNPEELARIDRLEEKLMAEMEPEERERDGGIFGLGQLMTSVTKLVETTGSKVLSGGLDTLETIGKKTMEVLQDGDPGLKKKRALFTDKTVLSQILREAKEKAETEDRETEDQQAKRNVHFETLFDDYQGLVHLEALEMLSKQCDMKLHASLLSLSGPALVSLQDSMQRVRDACQLPDDEEQADDWREQLLAAEKQLGVPMATAKLVAVWQESCDWPAESDGAPTMSEIHQKAVSTLARLTAVSVEQFHKVAEMLLVKDKREAMPEATALITVTTVLCCLASSAATRFCELLNQLERSDHVNSLITSVFLEASNSSSYIQEAFQLLIPVLQVGTPA